MLQFRWFQIEREMLRYLIITILKWHSDFLILGKGGNLAGGKSGFCEGNPRGCPPLPLYETLGKVVAIVTLR